MREGRPMHPGGVSGARCDGRAHPAQRVPGVDAARVAASGLGPEERLLCAFARGRITSQALPHAADSHQVATVLFVHYRHGCTMHCLMLQLQRALCDARTIAFVGEWVYAGCAARDFSCALDPMWPCNKTGAPSLDDLA